MSNNDTINTLMNLMLIRDPIGRASANTLLDFPELKKVSKQLHT